MAGRAGGGAVGGRRPARARRPLPPAVAAAGDVEDQARAQARRARDLLRAPARAGDTGGHPRTVPLRPPRGGAGRLPRARGRARRPSRSTRWPPSCRGSGPRSCVSRRTPPAATAASSRSCWPSACPASWWRTCRAVDTDRRGWGRVGAPQSAETEGSVDRRLAVVVLSSVLVLLVRAGPRPRRDHGAGCVHVGGLDIVVADDERQLEHDRHRRSTSRRGRTCQRPEPARARRPATSAQTVGGTAARWWRARARSTRSSSSATAATTRSRSA